jgi:hypothetical protein
MILLAGITGDNILVHVMAQKLYCVHTDLGADGNPAGTHEVKAVWITSDCSESSRVDVSGCKQQAES